jgi:hypothetical protein
VKIFWRALGASCQDMATSYIAVFHIFTVYEAYELIIVLELISLEIPKVSAKVLETY